MVNILKEIGIILRTHGKESNPLFSLNTVASHVPTVLYLDDGDTIRNPYDIAHAFYNYYASIAETTKKSIKYSCKHFSDYLSNETSTVYNISATYK